MLQINNADINIKKMKIIFCIDLNNLKLLGINPINK